MKKRFGAIRRGMAFGLGAVLLASSALAADSPGWRPVASERLIKLPSNLMARSIERDFANSALAEALSENRQDVGYKAQTLRDLQLAAEQAQGEDVRTELRHQYLSEKREFIALMGRQQELQRERVEVRQKLYADVLEKLSESDEELTPQSRQLIENQEMATERFESSIAKVDLQLFGSGFVEESRYAKSFAKNMQALEKLTAAIQAHPLNAEAHGNGDMATKQDYVRHLLAETESELSILDQEGAVLGYMAKLVALDALALAEGIDDPGDFGDPTNPEEEGVLVSVVDLFVE